MDQPRRPPVEPVTLDSLETWLELIRLAERHAVAGAMPEAERLMTRLFRELALADLQRLVAATAEAWLGRVEADEARAASVGAAVDGCLAAIGAEDFRRAEAALQPVVSAMDRKDLSGLKLTLLLLGLIGASRR